MSNKPPNRTDPPKTSTAIERAPNVVRMDTMLAERKQEVAMLLPPHVSLQRFRQVALLALGTNSTLAECTPRSLFLAVLQCATLGLELNTPLGEAYLVRYDVTVDRRTGQKEPRASLIVGYRGLIKLAIQSGMVTRIRAHAVYAKDVFRVVRGLREELIHEPDELARDRGELLGAYAVADLANGGQQFDVMGREALEARAKLSRGSVPDDWPEEWAKKTVARRLLKWLPVSVNASQIPKGDHLPPVARALALDSADRDDEPADFSHLAEAVALEEGDSPALPAVSVSVPADVRGDRIADKVKRGARTPNDEYPAQPPAEPTPRPANDAGPGPFTNEDPFAAPKGGAS